jgi:16S rRNA (adenine1518-N6/adenine1519-N6)-dimethyltransferase
VLPVKLTSPSSARSILSQLGVHPSKKLGQNFLIDRNIAEIIIAAADLTGRDRALEIGPGLGVLTERLAASAESVTAIEIDAKLCAYLQERFREQPSVNLICGDILRLDPGGRFDLAQMKVVSNLPYSSGSRILMEFAMMMNRPACVVVTVQQEVADRMVAAEGSGDYGLLTIWLQTAYDVRAVKSVSPTCFWPVPVVQSCVVKMVRRPDALSGPEKKVFSRITKRCFSHRRKQVYRMLAAGSGLDNATVVELLGNMGLSPKARPSDISVEQWITLAQEIAGVAELAVRRT